MVFQEVENILKVSVFSDYVLIFLKCHAGPFSYFSYLKPEKISVTANKGYKGHSLTSDHTQHKVYVSTRNSECSRSTCEPYTKDMSRHSILNRRQAQYERYNIHLLLCIYFRDWHTAHKGASFTMQASAPHNSSSF